MIEAKGYSPCSKCGEWIEPGQQMDGEKGARYHVNCPNDHPRESTPVITPAIESDPWPEALENHDCGDDFYSLTKDGVGYMICFCCKKEFPDNGKLKSVPSRMVWPEPKEATVVPDELGPDQHDPWCKGCPVCYEEIPF